MIIMLGEETGLILCQSDIITFTEKDEGALMGATLHGLQYSFKIQIDVKFSVKSFMVKCKPRLLELLALLRSRGP